MSYQLEEGASIAREVEVSIFVCYVIAIFSLHNNF